MRLVSRAARGLRQGRWPSEQGSDFAGRSRHWTPSHIRTGTLPASRGDKLVHAARTRSTRRGATRVREALLRTSTRRVRGLSKRDQSLGLISNLSYQAFRAQAAGMEHQLAYEELVLGCMRYERIPLRFNGTMRRLGHARLDLASWLGRSCVDAARPTRVSASPRASRRPEPVGSDARAPRWLGLYENC